jgi:hypothetical protein
MHTILFSENQVPQPGGGAIPQSARDVHCFECGHLINSLCPASSHGWAIEAFNQTIIQGQLLVALTCDDARAEPILTRIIVSISCPKANPS